MGLHCHNVVVKEATSISSATLLPSDEVIRRIESAAVRAVRKLLDGQYQPWHLAGPYQWEISFLNPRQAEWAAIYPGVERTDTITLSFQTEDWVEGYELVTDKLIPLAIRERIYTLQEVVDDLPNAGEIRQRARQRLLERWYQGYPPAEPLPPPPVRARYHGVR